MSSSATPPPPMPNPLEQFEHAYYIGNYMSGILYGVDLMLFFMTLKNLRYNRSSDHRGNMFLGIYSTILVLLLTIDIATNAVWGEQLWITSRSTLPGGPLEFFATEVNVWYENFGSTTVVAIIFMADAFLIYRCFILWESNWYIVLLPILVYLCAFALAIIELVESFIPHGNFFGGKSVVFGTTYYAMTISINILVTSLITGRLLYLSKLMKSSLGTENAKLYTSVATMLIESAALYSIFGIMWLIPYAKQSQIAVAFGQVWAKVAAISPQLIILRVASGRAWRKDTVSHARSTTVAFNSHGSNGKSVSVPLSQLGSNRGPLSTQDTKYDSSSIRAKQSATDFEKSYP